MLPADRLVDVLVEDGAGGDDDVDETPVDGVADHLPESRGDQRTGEPQEDGGPLPVGEGVLPDLERPAEVARLDGGSLELAQKRPKAVDLGDVDRHDALLQDRPARGVDLLRHGPAQRGAVHNPVGTRGPDAGK